MRAQANITTAAIAAALRGLTPAEAVAVAIRGRSVSQAARQRIEMIVAATLEGAYRAQLAERAQVRCANEGVSHAH